MTYLLMLLALVSTPNNTTPEESPLELEQKCPHEIAITKENVQYFHCVGDKFEIKMSDRAYWKVIHKQGEYILQFSLTND